MLVPKLLYCQCGPGTATYYIKTAAGDVKSAMAKLESGIPTVPEINGLFSWG